MQYISNYFCVGSILVILFFCYRIMVQKSASDFHFFLQRLPQHSFSSFFLTLSSLFLHLTLTSIFSLNDFFFSSSSLSSCKIRLALSISVFLHYINHASSSSLSSFYERGQMRGFDRCRQWSWCCDVFLEAEVNVLDDG